VKESTRVQYFVEKKNINSNCTVLEFRDTLTVVTDSARKNA
jgi:hypothetical protein